MSVLAEIVARKRVDVAARRRPLPTPPRSTRSLSRALDEPGVGFVLELKQASPSAGVLRESFPVPALVGALGPVARALSVLTDTPYFGGSLERLAQVRPLFDGPLLLKDFVVEPFQITEGRANGADAALLMMSVLEDATARACLDELERLGMEALVEVHDEAELARALALGARVVGINNRDLRTLSIALATTERLAPLVPRDRLVIAESGVRTDADVSRLAAHADAFLVGSSVMAAADPHDAARALTIGRVKICGLTRAEDAERARALGARWGGVILVPGTPRYAPHALEAVAATGLPLVAVFRDPSPDQVASVARRVPLAAVQLHGRETATDRAAIRDALGAILGDAVRHAPRQAPELWQAVSIALGDDVPARLAEARVHADRLVLDRGAGGTGETFPWSLLAGLDLSRDLLAGGLGPDNAAAARALGTFGLDASSRLERAPGEKDPHRLEAFFQALRPRRRGELR